MKSAEQNSYYGFCGHNLQFAGVSLKARAWCSWLVSRCGAGRWPRQQVAKGDAASIRRSIPLSQEKDLKRPGDYSGGPGFCGVGYDGLGNKVEAMTDERRKECPEIIHRNFPCIFRKKSGIIARKFGIINYILCGSQGTEGRPGQIGGLHGHGSEAVCNRGIISHGKIGAKILLISGGVIR